MLTHKLSNRKIKVDILAILFGIGAWIGINGIFVQLPILMSEAPEGYSLPAYTTMIIQFANIGPILYTVYSKYAPKNGIQDNIIIYILLGAASVALYLLAFLYMKTSFIFGQEYSTALLSLMFITAVVGCTSSILFTPYMRNYREIYLVSYLIGEGLSGFIPSIVALIQGVGETKCVNATLPGSDTITFKSEDLKPRFSTTVFFIFIGCLLLTSLLSFIGLNNLSVAKCERVKPIESSEALRTDTNAPPNYKTRSGWLLPRRTYYYLLIMLAFICFLSNGTLPGIQSYSCSPYGRLAYHLTITLASMAQPLAMSLGFIVKTYKTTLLTNLMVISLVLTGFVCYLAVSHNPPFQDSILGVIMVVLSWVLISGLMGFIKMAITTLFRLDPGKGLYYTGVVTQVGSFIGAIATFFMIKGNLFHSYSVCDALAKQ